MILRRQKGTEPFCRRRFFRIAAGFAAYYDECVFGAVGNRRVKILFQDKFFTKIKNIFCMSKKLPAAN